MKTDQVMKNLKAIHDPRRWAFFEELRIGTGYGKDSEQRFDAWAIHYHPSKRNVTRCYELKISRGDFKKEIKNPKKRRPGLRLANEFYFVTPKNLCKIEEIPVDCGLIEVDEGNSLITTIKAPFRDVGPPTWLFVSSVCRRIDRPRLDEFLTFVKEDGKLQMYGMAVVQALKDHIDRWESYDEGNKEVPDKIADALTEVYYDAMDIIDNNKRIR